jgi:hypothetical protein
MTSACGFHPMLRWMNAPLIQQLDPATYLELRRLPELLRGRGPGPTLHPVACS